MAAPTILAQGNADQIDRHVTPILDGQLGWAQLFSEPGAGSDLAGLTTRAERDGDRWIITGQKVWSSHARRCDYGMLLARTSFDVPKHKGISWFAFKLDQPGVTVRPLREMTGDDIFNEIFIDEAVVDDADLIGGEGNGWMVTQTTLHFERTGHRRRWRDGRLPLPRPQGRHARAPGRRRRARPARRRQAHPGVRGRGRRSPAALVAPTTPTCARSCHASTPTRRPGSGTRSAARPKPVAAAVRRSAASPSSPRPGS